MPNGINANHKKNLLHGPANTVPQCSLNVQIATVRKTKDSKPVIVFG